MNHPHAQRITITPDLAINLMACVWKQAFDDAQTDYSARQDIIDFFGIERVMHLYHLGCITWDPRAVPIQNELWEV